MKVVVNALLSELESEINRQIIVDESIKLTDFCEYIIVSMNGSKMPLYTLEYNKIVYYPYNGNETAKEKTMLNLTLKDLKLKKGSRLGINYNPEKWYYINVTIDDIGKIEHYEASENFKVLSGKGYGLLDNLHKHSLISLLTSNRPLDDEYYRVSERKFLQQKFDCTDVNIKVQEYAKNKVEQRLPKKYIFNVVLYGFEKEIKRKIAVNNDIIIREFCKKIIVSMNGDLSHGFGIKIGKEYLEDFFDDMELYYLGLEEKQKFTILYDWGDDWKFKLTLSKITDGHSENDFEVLSGKGYGIIDDCGGIWGLDDIFKGLNTDWGKYDIEEFDLEECNKSISTV